MYSLQLLPTFKDRPHPLPSIQFTMLSKKLLALLALAVGANAEECDLSQMDEIGTGQGGDYHECLQKSGYFDDQDQAFSQDSLVTLKMCVTEECWRTASLVEQHQQKTGCTIEVYPPTLGGTLAHFPKICLHAFAPKRTIFDPTRLPCDENAVKAILVLDKTRNVANCKKATEFDFAAPNGSPSVATCNVVACQNVVTALRNVGAPENCVTNYGNGVLDLIMRGNEHLCA